MEKNQRYFSYFEQKKASSIDYLTYQGKKCTSDKDKANALCDFYTNIGKTIENKIPQSKRNFKDYLTQLYHKQILRKPCTELEINDIIKSLNVSKSAGPNSIPTNLIHTSLIILIPILTILIKISAALAKALGAVKL